MKKRTTTWAVKHDHGEWVEYHFHKGESVHALRARAERESGYHPPRKVTLVEVEVRDVRTVDVSSEKDDA